MPVTESATEETGEQTEASFEVVPLVEDKNSEYEYVYYYIDEGQPIPNGGIVVGEVVVQE